MAYGTIKVDNITFDNGGVDKLITVSGLFYSTSGALTVTGTISGGNVTAPTATFTTLTGTTTAGTTATFTSGSFTSLTGVTTTVTSGVFGLGSAAAPSITFSGDPNTGIYSPGADQVAISTSGTGRVFVDASGNVGVGITPVANTLIGGARGSSLPGLIELAGNGNTVGSSGFAIGQDSSGVGVLFQRANAAMYFATNGTERLRITSAGLVGVGDSSPGALLSLKDGNVDNVSGSKLRMNLGPNPYWEIQANNGGTSATRKLEFYTSFGPTSVLTLLQSGNVGVGTTSPATALDVYGDINIRNGYNLTWGGAYGANIPTIYASSGVSAFIAFAPAGSTLGEKARFDASGRLGIGTSAPTAPLDVAETSGSALRLRRITSGNNVDVNFFNPITTAGDVARIRMDGDGVSNAYGALSFWTTQTPDSLVERLRITSAGLVGIGTSSPNSTLDVRGIVNLGDPTVTGSTRKHFVFTGGAITSDTTNGLTFKPGSASTTDQFVRFETGGGTLVGAIGNVGDGLSIWTRDTSNALTVTQAGRLGIGTTSPQEALDINGSIRGALPTDVLGQDITVTPTESGFLKFTSAQSAAGTREYNIFSFNTEYFPSSNQTTAAIAVRPFFTADGNGRAGASLVFKTGARQAPGTSPFQRFLDSMVISDLGTTTLTSEAAVAPFIANIGASEVARIDSSGRLLVGTSSARTNFYLGADNITPFNQVETTTNSYSNGISLLNYSLSGYPPTLNFGISQTNTTGTNTLVGTTDLGIINFTGNDGTNFRTAATIRATTDGTAGSGDMPGRLVFSTTADGAASPTEAMRINSAGQIGLGDTNPAAAAERVSIFSKTLAGVQYCSVSTVTTDSLAYHQRFVNTNGVVGSISTTAVATLYSTSSDYRLKENVTPVLDGIARFKQLKPSRFNFIADPDKTVDGFLAHEVQEVVPEAIIGEKDAVDADGNPVYQGIDQSKLVPLLTAALQEAIAKIESLEARLTAAGI